MLSCHGQTLSVAAVTCFPFSASKADTGFRTHTHTLVIFRNYSVLNSFFNFELHKIEYDESLNELVHVHRNALTEKKSIHVDSYERERVIKYVYL